MRCLRQYNDKTRDSIQTQKQISNGNLKESHQFRAKNIGHNDNHIYVQCVQMLYHQFNCAMCSMTRPDYSIRVHISDVHRTTRLCAI